MAENLIVSDPQILGGKPCVRGTRLSVEFLLEFAASGGTQEQMLAQYPQLTTASPSISCWRCLQVLNCDVDLVVRTKTA